MKQKHKPVRVPLQAKFGNIGHIETAGYGILGRVRGRSGNVCDSMCCQEEENEGYHGR